jgi:hypothetical protein
MSGEDDDLLAHPDALPAYNANGTVEAVVPGRMGEIRALLLSNNTTVFLPRSLSESLLAHGVQQGQTVRVTGRGGSYHQGASVFAVTVILPDGTNLTAHPPTAAAPAAPHGP